MSEKSGQSTLNATLAPKEIRLYTFSCTRLVCVHLLDNILETVGTIKHWHRAEGSGILHFSEKKKMVQMFAYPANTEK